MAEQTEFAEALCLLSERKLHVVPLGLSDLYIEVGACMPIRKRVQWKQVASLLEKEQQQAVDFQAGLQA
ncbi:hypothetical protein [Stutzerimonas stutzeri]|uniref:hypothetical protein n=1 Tax=Stutzerimonas stutzeri TaxID=316 RepID=UPI003012D9A1